MYFDSEIWILRQHTKDKQIQLDRHHHPYICWLVDCRCSHHHHAHVIVMVTITVLYVLHIHDISFIDALIQQKRDLYYRENQFSWAIKEIYFYHITACSNSPHPAKLPALSIFETLPFFGANSLSIENHIFVRESFCANWWVTSLAATFEISNWLPLSLAKV